jgi:hypothetical protein
MGLKSTLMVMLLLLVTSLIYPTPPSQKDIAESSIQQVYESLNDTSLNFEAFQTGMIGYKSLTSQRLVLKDSLITIIDYSLPSSDDRIYVIDLHLKSIVYKTLVAHGRNSGELYANRFSNNAQSYQSALGFYITGSPYKGGQGYSMLLNGVDTGYNDHARVRSIVMHGAGYVTRNYINRYGRLGRSFGCPALPPDKNGAIIDLIKDGSVLFSFYPDQTYLNRSKVLGYIPGEPMTAASNL